MDVAHATLAMRDFPSELMQDLLHQQQESCMKRISLLADLPRTGSTAKPPANPNPVFSMSRLVSLQIKWLGSQMYLHPLLRGFQWFPVTPRLDPDVVPRSQLSDSECAILCLPTSNSRCDVSAYEPPFPLNPDMFALYEIYMRDVRLLGDVPMLSLKTWKKWAVDGVVSPDVKQSRKK